MALTYLRPIYYWIVLFSLISSSIKAQTVEVEGNNLIEEYSKTFGDYSSLFYGKSEVPLANNLQSPYLSKEDYSFNNSFHNSNLLYDNIYYPNISARINIYTNEIIVLNSSTTSNIVLNSKLLNYIDILDQRLVYLSPENSSIETGLYVLLYSNSISIYKKYKLRIITLPSLEKQLAASPVYYLLIDGKFHQIKSQNSILNIFKSKEKELKQFIKENDIDFKQNKEEAFIRITEQYEKMNDL